MPRRVTHIDVEREVETTLYRVCRDLEIHGKSIVKNANEHCWESPGRKLGLRGKPLIEHDPPLLYPIARTRHSKHHNISLIQVPNNVIVKEEQRGKKSRFRFFLKKML